MKRLLSIDGGGLRGMFALAILARIERLLKDAHGEHYGISDHFHYIGGTSTGAIIASLLSWGYSATEIINKYQEMGQKMFEANFVWKVTGGKIPAAVLAGEKFKAQKISEVLRTYFKEADGADALLGSQSLKTKLLVVTKNARTGSTWPLTNNPDATFNQNPEKHPWSNLNFPLWKVIRASTAAPTYFPPEEFTIFPKSGGEPFKCAFQDGGVTPYNNPAYLLYLKATLPEYKTNWKTGEENLHLVSVGTGYVDLGSQIDKAENVPDLLDSIPKRLIQLNQVHQDLLCRTTGRCLFGADIDSEIGSLVRPKTDYESSQFTYARYNHHFSFNEKKQDPNLSFPYPELIKNKLPMESAEILEPLLNFGREYAHKSLKLEHLR